MKIHRTHISSGSEPYKSDIKPQPKLTSHLTHYFDEDSDSKKKRVGKACDACRMKKTKCDGIKPCSRCTQENKVCTYTEKKRAVEEKPHSKEYVELLENRIDVLQTSLKEIIARISEDSDLSDLKQFHKFSVNKTIDVLFGSDSDFDASSSGEESSNQDHIKRPRRGNAVETAATSPPTNEVPSIIDNTSLQSSESFTTTETDNSVNGEVVTSSIKASVTEDRYEKSRRSRGPSLSYLDTVNEKFADDSSSLSSGSPSTITSQTASGFSDHVDPSPQTVDFIDGVALDSQASSIMGDQGDDFLGPAQVSDYVTVLDDISGDSMIVDAWQVSVDDEEASDWPKWPKFFPSSVI